MKKLAWLLVLMACIPVFVQPVSAWGAPNHYEIAAGVYYSLPSDVQSKLNLSQMIDGADDPDYKFFDYKYHHYPLSQEKANYWLSKGRESYFAGNYNEASYCFGVATHYLSDGVCPPHSGGGHSGFNHLKFELEALLFKPHLSSEISNSSIDMAQYESVGETEWDEWLRTGDPIYIQQSLDRALEVSSWEVKKALE